MSFERILRYTLFILRKLPTFRLILAEMKPFASKAFKMLQCWFAFALFFGVSIMGRMFMCSIIVSVQALTLEFTKQRSWKNQCFAFESDFSPAKSAIWFTFSKALKHAKVAMIAWLLWCPFCIFHFSQQSRLFLLLSGIMFSLWMISNMVLCSDILLPIFFPRWTAQCYLCSCPEIWTGIVYKTCRNA